jgi:hypothetical protein
MERPPMTAMQEQLICSLHKRANTTPPPELKKLDEREARMYIERLSEQLALIDDEESNSLHRDGVGGACLPLTAELEGPRHREVSGHVSARNGLGSSSPMAAVAAERGPPRPADTGLLS